VASPYQEEVRDDRRTNERGAGYGYGAPDRAHSALGMEDLDLLKQTVLFTGEDERYLRMAGDVLEDQIEDVLVVWCIQEDQSLRSQPIQKTKDGFGKWRYRGQVTHQQHPVENLDPLRERWSASWAHSGC
jgi:hypothetical protein